MRLASLTIDNFRSCYNVTVQFDGYTSFVGPNGAGKSTILAALNILFRHAAGSATSVTTLKEEDFYAKDVTRPVVISATFTELTTAEATEFSTYVRQGQLTISAKATWDQDRSTAEVRQYGSRLVMADFAPFFEQFDGDGTAADLRRIYAGLQVQYPDLPRAVAKDAMRTALREYEEAHSEHCTPRESADEFYGWSRGGNKLSKFLQWVYIPAVKDASGEQEAARNTALGDLLNRTVNETLDFDTELNALRAETEDRYRAIVDAKQGALEGLSTSLGNRLREWTHPDSRVELRWEADAASSVRVEAPAARAAIGEHAFLGEIARAGHGMQRAFIISVLQELASHGGDDSRLLVLGFEEPELYQHPPQARHLASVLEELSTKNAQVIVTTHSPYFVSAKGFANIRAVRKERTSQRCVVSSLSPEQLASIIAAALGEQPQSPTTVMAAVEQIMQPSQNELFFCNVPILVEGPEDVAFLATYLHLTGRWTQFRGHGGHFVVTGGKTNISRPLAIANGLGIPAFVVCDADGNAAQNDLDRHRKDNKCILNLCGHADADALPALPFWGANVIMWPTQILPTVRDDVQVEIWNSAVTQVRAKQHFADGIKHKNSRLVSAVVEQLWENGVRSNLLDRACESMLTFAATRR